MKRLLYIVLGIIFIAVGIYVIPQAFQAKTSFVADFLSSLSGIGIVCGSILIFLSIFGEKKS